MWSSSFLLLSLILSGLQRKRLSWNSGFVTAFYVRSHSRPQRPWSFWSAPRSETSGHSQLREVRDSRTHCSSLIGWKLQNEYSAHAQKLVMARGLDSWCWPKELRPLGTRMVRSVANHSQVLNTHARRYDADLSLASPLWRCLFQWRPFPLPRKCARLYSHFCNVNCSFWRKKRGGKWSLKKKRSRKILVKFHGSRSLVFFCAVLNLSQSRIFRKAGVGSESRSRNP